MLSYSFAVTNDDGPDSPLAQALIQELAKRPWCNALKFALPAQEQSWIADAITRFRTLNVTSHSIGSVKGYLVDGTPADCASLVIDHLHQGVKPQFLVSGINMGTNAGLPFFLCSGTVGGSTQAFLNGVPAVALSASIPAEVYKMWIGRDLVNLEKFAADYKRIAEVCLTVVERLVKNQAWRHADLYSVNVPWTVSQSSPLSFSFLTRGTYKPLFEKVGENQYKHKFNGFSDLDKTPSPNHTKSDFDLVDTNQVSISAIRYNLEAALPQDFLTKFNT